MGMCGHQPSAARHRISDIQARVNQRLNQRVKFVARPGIEGFDSLW